MEEIEKRLKINRKLCSSLFKKYSEYIKEKKDKKSKDKKKSINFKFWKLINSKQRQHYLFVTRYKLPFEVKILDGYGLTLGDVTNQATEMVRALVNSIYSKNIKNGLSIENISKEIMGHSLITQILRIERFADIIINSKNKLKK